MVEGTALAARLRPGAGLDGAAMPADPNDDVRAAGYRRIVRALSRAGYGWYEVSNFALPGQPGAPQRGVLARPARTWAWAPAP